MLTLTLHNPDSDFGIVTSPLKSNEEFLRVCPTVSRPLWIPACNISGIVTPLLGFKFTNSLFKLLGSNSFPDTGACEEYSEDEEATGSDEVSVTVVSLGLD